MKVNKSLVIETVIATVGVLFLTDLLNITEVN